jgi:hypothetical protein
MSNDISKKDESLSPTNEVYFTTLRGVKVPEGVIASPYPDSLPQEIMDVTTRSKQMTKGIFDFAEMVRQPESKERAN